MPVRIDPGAPDFETWKERQEARNQMNEMVAVGADGNQGALSRMEDDENRPIELTEKSMVMRDKFFNIAFKKRTAEHDFAKFHEMPDVSAFVEAAPIVPEESPRHCEVHSCVLVDGDETCAEGLPGCTAPRGHLRPFGEQMDLERVGEHHHLLPPDAAYFWREHIAKYEPVHLRGAAAAVTDLAGWTDEALLGASNETGRPKCALDNGRPWYVTVEQNNRISHNDRLPLAEGYDFCRYLREYRDPGAPTYCIHAITDDSRTQLPRAIALPAVLNCEDLYQSMHAVRMWMSRGNTTSSQHFDTHDNLMLQIDGTKDIYMSHPNESSRMYMDHHDKFGLSPINVDRVDLERFPRFADARVQHVRLEPGDALYIPDGYWHVIRSHGRNIALAFEFAAPRRPQHQPWTAALMEFERHPGTLWGEKRRLEATMKEAWARSDPGEMAQCTEPLAQPPRTLADYRGWSDH